MGRNDVGRDVDGRKRVEVVESCLEDIGGGAVCRENKYERKSNGRNVNRR